MLVVFCTSKTDWGRLMLESTKSITCIEELRSYVAGALGKLEMLRAEQFELTQQLLCRGGKPCGIYFQLQGPRALVLSAIWETERNTILFYGSCGTRVHRTKLSASPSLLATASA
jgi:hypothetical protein